MQTDFEEKIREITVAAPDYDAEAYRFVSAAVNYTVGKLKKRRHVSGGELLSGAAEFAEKEFGVVAKLVLGEWGLHCGSDIGEVVYRLIGAGLLAASPEDKREDFDVPFAWFPAPPERPEIAVPQIDVQQEKEK